MIDQCPNCKSKKLIYIEYAYGTPEHYDGISEVNCLECKKRYGRWTDEELADGELEPKYGIKLKRNVTRKKK